MIITHNFHLQTERNYSCPKGLSRKEENSDYLKSEDLNLGLIKIIISNTTDDEITVDLTAFHIESGAFSLQFYYPLVMYYNDCGMYIKLSKGEQKTFIAPVPISSEQFLNYDSTDIRNRTYYLVSIFISSKNNVRSQI